MSEKFDGFTDEELSRELARRKAVRVAKEKEDRAARRVTVLCPSCDGSGQRRSTDIMRVASGEADEFVKCGLCHGSGRITAYKPKA